MYVNYISYEMIRPYSQYFPYYEKYLPALIAGKATVLRFFSVALRSEFITALYKSISHLSMFFCKDVNVTKYS